MRRPALQWAVLAVVGIVAVALVALLGPPDGDTDQRPSVTTAQEGVGLVEPDRLAAACTAQLGAAAEAVWASTAWLCAGLRGGLWGTEELEVARICGGMPTRSASPSGVVCD